MTEPYGLYRARLLLAERGLVVRHRGNRRRRHDGLRLKLMPWIVARPRPENARLDAEIVAEFPSLETLCRAYGVPMEWDGDWRALSLKVTDDQVVAVVSPAGSSIQEVAAGLGVSTETARHRLRELAAAGRVRAERARASNEKRRLPLWTFYPAP